MKKILLGLAAMAGMLFAASCAKDAGTAAPSDNQTAVTFNVGLDHVLSSRAISDGKSADQLFYQVFNNQYEPVGDVEPTTLTNGSATVSITLVKDKEYTVAFWAQNSACKAYDLENFPTVEVSYDGAKNNDETRDAFFGTASVIAGQTQSVSVKLKRPFAQINFAVQDLQDDVTESSMTADGVGTSLNLLSKTVSGDDKAVFAATNIPTETLPDKDDYTWLSMSYVLVPAEGTTLDLTFTFDNEKREISGISAKANYRTNLLASGSVVDTDFEVEIEPGYGGSDDDQDIPFEGEGEEKTTFTVSEVKADYKDGTVTFSASFEGDKDKIESAYFCYAAAADALVRAEAEAQKVKAEVGEGTLTATLDAKDLAPGKYEITVEINGETVAATDADTTEDNTFEIPEEEPEDGVKVVTIAAFLEAEVSTEQVYELTGVVSNIINTQYGNFDLTDETGKVYVYGLTKEYVASNDKSFESLGVSAGDKITIRGYRAAYNNDPQVGSAWLIKIDEYAPTIDSFEVEYNEDANTATFTATYTNKSELSLKAGFKYTGTDLEKTVDMESVSGGTFITTISTADLTPGKYTVTAFLNDVVSTAKSFTIKDPSGDNEPKEYVDVLNNAFTGISGTTYTAWSDKAGSASEAVYAGQSAGGDSNSGTSIQLRSTNSNSGIVSTTSGGTVKKVVVTWNSATSSTGNRTLDVYGKNTAYTSAENLYNSSTQGTKLGTITCGTATELEIDGSYEFIGLRSNNGAMYLNEIQITWEK